MMKNKVATVAGFIAPCIMLSASVCVASEQAGRIINGTEANKGDWPFMTALIENSISHQGLICGASFLGGRYVLTASHCVDDLVTSNSNTYSAYVSIGVHDLNNIETEGQKAEIQNIYMHEGYSTSTMHNDVAIIELTKEVTAQSVELSTVTLENSLKAGDTTTVMGWGNRSTTSNDYPSVLHQVDLPYVDRATCQNLGGLYSLVYDGSMCAGYAEGGKDSCQGDSGGPLVYNDDGTYKQIGVVSWGDGCAQANAYGVYANVAYFTDWIAAKTSGVSYRQRFNTLSSKQNIQVVIPLKNYGTESFDVKNFELPVGVTVANNACTSTLNQGDSCTITMNIDRKAAGFLPNHAGQDLKFKIITDHSKASELQVMVHFNNIYIEDETPNDTTDPVLTSTTSSSSSGGASFGLGLLALFTFVGRRRRSYI